MRIIISAIFFVVGILLFFFAAGYNMIGLCFVGAAILLFISRFGRRGHRLIAIMLAVFVPTLIGLEIPIPSRRAHRCSGYDRLHYCVRGWGKRHHAFAFFVGSPGNGHFLFKSTSKLPGCSFRWAGTRRRGNGGLGYAGVFAAPRDCGRSHFVRRYGNQY